MFLPFPATLECSQRLMYATDSRKEAREILLAEYISNCHENETKEYEWGELSREYANRHMSSLSLFLSLSLSLLPFPFFSAHTMRYEQYRRSSMSNEESTLVVGPISHRIDSTDTNQSYSSSYRRASRSAILSEMRNAVFLVELSRSLPFTILNLILIFRIAVISFSPKFVEAVSRLLQNVARRWTLRRTRHDRRCL